MRFYVSENYKRLKHFVSYHLLLRFYPSQCTSCYGVRLQIMHIFGMKIGRSHKGKFDKRFSCLTCFLFFFFVNSVMTHTQTLLLGQGIQNRKSNVCFVENFLGDLNERKKQTHFWKTITYSMAFPLDIMLTNVRLAHVYVRMGIGWVVLNAQNKYRLTRIYL